MKKTIAVAMIGLTVGLGFATDSKAEERSWEWSPIGLGIAAPIQLPYTETDVLGFRFGGFFGWNQDVYGLDVGVTELCMGSVIGLQAAAFTWTEEDAIGLQYGALANVVDGKMRGLQIGTVNVDWGDTAGIQIGTVNYDVAFRGIQIGGAVNWNTSAAYGLEIGVANANQDEFIGCALGCVNYSESFTGFECGVVNVSYEATGCQLGLVNACDRMHGVQIGLINLICESKLPAMIIANASF